MNNDVAVSQSDRPAACTLCHRLLSSDDDNGDLEAISICGDCKFLFLEDHESTIQDNYRTRVRELRRRRYRSSEPIEGLFSQQFSRIIDQARQSQATFLEHDNISIDGDAAAMLVQRASSQTTPNSSRRWRRVLSDTESDGFDSLFGEGESNVSLSGSRYLYAESDSISFSAYGGESDVSVDDDSFLENENYGHPDGVSDHDTDTDIDPMHAGLYHWDSDDAEVDDEDQYANWEEPDAEESTVTTSGTGTQPGISFSPRESSVNTGRQLALSPQFEGTIHLRIQERIRGHFANLFDNLEGPSGQYVGNREHFLRGRGFEELLEHLAESENSRRGAPPAAVSVVSNLPQLVIGESPEKLDVLACAICKDSLPVGTIVNQLPCFHLYHPSCILPWLSSRNTCPLCRYELPTDDNNYEDRRQRSNSVLDVQEYQQQDMNEDVSLDDTEGAEAEFDHNRMENGEQVNVNLVEEMSGRENARRGWMFLAAAAAPIVGIVLVFCLGNRVTDRRWPGSGPNFSGLERHPGHCLFARTPIPGDNGRNRRWWCLFQP